MSWLNALLGRIQSSGVSIPLTAGLNFTGGLKAQRNLSTRVTDVSLDSAVVAPANVAVVSSDMSVPFVIRKVISAGGGGADDVEIVASATFGFRILNVWHRGVVVAGTWQLRTETGGGGSALSSVHTLSPQGTRLDNQTQVSPTVAAGGAVHLRRSDSTSQGEITILAERI